MTEHFQARWLIFCEKTDTGPEEAQATDYILWLAPRAEAFKQREAIEFITTDEEQQAFNRFLRLTK